MNLKVTKKIIKGVHMIRKILISLLCIIFITGTITGGFLFLYFAIPSKKAMNSIELPSHVEDTGTAEETTEEIDEATSGTYVADVYQSLTLRVSPSSNAAEIVGLPPMTHMEIIEYVEGTNYAYVLVTNGANKGYKGYVNTDYITPLGESTIRVNSD
jgi:hypothetical protein